MKRWISMLLFLLLTVAPLHLQAGEPSAEVLKLTPISAADEWLSYGSLDEIEDWIDSELTHTQSAEMRSNLLAAKAYLRSIAGELTQANELAEQAVSEDKDNVQARLFAACLSKGKDALEKLNAIPDDGPCGEAARLVRVGHLIQEGMWLEAQGLMNVKMDLSYGDLMRAYMSLAFGKSGDQLFYANRYLQKHRLGTIGQKFLPHYLKVRALHTLARPLEAKQAALEGLALCPDDESIKQYLVAACVKLEEHEAALRAAQGMAEREPNSPLATWAFAECYTAQEMWDEALPHLRTLHTQVPTDTMGAYKLMVACMFAGEYEEATRALSVNEGPQRDPEMASRFQFLTALCRCHDPAVPDEQKSGLKPILIAGLEANSFYMRDRLWAIAALNNLGERESAQRYVTAIGEENCTPVEAVLLKRVNHVIESEEQLHPHERADR